MPAISRNDNLEHLEDQGIDAYVAVRRDKHSSPPHPRPGDASPRTSHVVGRMARKLRTKKGRAHYGRRKVIVEPVFGQIKEAMGFRRFSLRGKAKVTAEWQSRLRQPRRRRAVPQWPSRAGHRWLGPPQGPKGPRMGMMRTHRPRARTQDRSPSWPILCFGPLSHVRAGDYEHTRS